MKTYLITEIYAPFDHKLLLLGLGFWKFSCYILTGKKYRPNNAPFKTVKFKLKPILCNTGFYWPIKNLLLGKTFYPHSVS